MSKALTGAFRAERCAARKRNKCNPSESPSSSISFRLIRPRRFSRNSVVCLYKSSHSAVFRRSGIVYQVHQPGLGDFRILPAKACILAHPDGCFLPETTLHVTYLAHDLDDPAIWRRVEMLRRGGATVRVAGFRRGQGPLPEPATVLGRTANGRMVQRVRAILAAWPRIARAVPAPDGPEVILARNLEMLALGARLARMRKARLVYELLDIHGMMLAQGAVARALRRVEAALMRRAGLVVLSSPAFAARYLGPHGQPEVPALLVENKPFARPQAARTDAPAPGGLEQGGPLVIGWFGMLRCRWSLEVLDQLTRARPGRFRVVLRGRPALDVMENFHAVIEANPDLSFLGPYDWPGDLPGIYGGVDVAWLIDRYQAGQNSDWLLPNRLYEGCLNGAVPVVLEGTEVARRVAAWGCGVSVAAPEPEAVAAALSALDGAGLARRRAAVAAIPRTALEMDEAECLRLTAAICGTVAVPLAEAAAPAAPALAC